MIASRGSYPNSKLVTPNIRSSRNGGIAPVYMRAVSNTGASPRSCANATASRLMPGTSRNISPLPDAGKQGRQNDLGGGAVVGHQWADLAALPAWTDHAPAGKPAIAHDSATDMPGRADPGAQERWSRSRKHGRVVRLHISQGDFAQRDDAGVRRSGVALRRCRRNGCWHKRARNRISGSSAAAPPRHRARSRVGRRARWPHSISAVRSRARADPRARYRNRGRRSSHCN